jgi:flavorubredoxin
MNARKIGDGIWWVGAIDWDRRLFDALIPIPEGTSYNAYVVAGSEKTALLDTADPTAAEPFLAALTEFPRIDYVVAHHAEQDHSGLLPEVLRRYPGAVALCSPKAKGMLADLLPLPAERLRAVEDGEEVALGGRTMRFVHLPWVHWPETMATWIPENRALFPCDFFGSHLATSKLFADEDSRTLEAARLYYAQIMMPYANVIRKDLEKVLALQPGLIAPSHGPVHRDPAPILAAYGEWLNGPLKPRVVVAAVSMHGSTRAMTDRLVAELIQRGVDVVPFDLTALPLDRFASALVDASTIVFGASAVWNAPHPLAVMAMYVAAGLKPRARTVSLVGSYGWSAKALEGYTELLPGLKAEFLPPVLARGAPTEGTFASLALLAETIAARQHPASA